ncbi:WD40 repeat domain-containing protein [Flavisolibacter tropicus]|uniref:WD40 repeat domain-containing protein n=1 Tax=Flavisolibacter tropicus TaxID=1492898 RepID=UPI00083297D1|nr:WD40 repeat domain-containing protein [Flavisolibacter tropicus]
MIPQKTKRRKIQVILSLAFITIASILIFLSSSSPVKQITGSVASLNRKFEEHTESIWKVEFSPDDKLLASCSIDSTVIIRERETGRIRVILKHPIGVTNLEFSRDGNYLVTSAYDEKVRLWKIADGKLIKEFTGHKGTVWTVSISPDQKLIASGGEDKCIRLWSPESGALLKTIKAHDRNIWSVQFSPDGKTLASSSFDSDIKLWSIPDGNLLRTLSGHSEAVVSIAFSNSGQLLASAADDATLKVWNVQDGRLLQTLSTGDEHQHTVAFSPDDKRLVGGGSDKTTIGEFFQHLFGDSHRNKGISMRLWDIKTGHLLQTFMQHANDVNGVDYSADGHWIASGSADNTVCLWKVNQ